MIEPSAGPAPVLEIHNLSVGIRNRGGSRPIVSDFDLTVGAREAVGLIGESGSGKSTVALASLNYLAANLEVTSGRIRFCGDVDLLKAPRSLFGSRVAHVAQDPMGALNPIMRIGRQMTEGLRRHLNLTQAEAGARALRLLDEVRLPNGKAVLASLPYELSGGMQQRVCIAMALACDPRLLVLDEPTTGLDARTESAVLELLRELKLTRDLAILLISHNLAAVADLADRVTVMYGGRAVESGPTAEVLRRPAHRYTQLLLSAVPSMDGDRPLVDAPWQEAGFPSQGCAFRSRCDLAVAACETHETGREIAGGHRSRCVRADELVRGLHPLAAASGLLPRPAAAAGSTDVLALSDVSFAYGRHRGAQIAAARALGSVAVRVREGGVTALIGESGSGKSTLARLVVGLLRPQAGAIRLKDRDLSGLRHYPLDVCRRVQIVFQNVSGSLHPAKRARSLLSRPFRLYEGRSPAQEELRGLLTPVGLRAEVLPKRAASLSGGERQRLGLARATAPNPDVLVLDEAFSALDVSMKVRVARYLLDQARSSRTGCLLVTHELPFVRYLADDVTVLYRGWVCETGPSGRVLNAPHHPYTESLVWAARRLEGQRPARTDLFTTDASLGKVASFARSGCAFHTACPRKLGTICETQAPPDREGDEGHRVACHIPLVDLAALQKAEYAPVPGRAYV